MNLLQAIGLRKEFGGLKAVDHISFDVTNGEIVGLIGPNGAGKTTLFDVITGFLRVTDGTVFLWSSSVDEHGRLFGSTLS